MKSYTGIMIIIIGIIALSITQIVNDRLSYFSIGAIGIILVGLIWMYFNSKDSKQKFNFRKTDSEDNCTKCKYYVAKSFDGVQTNCKFLNIKVDEFHVCDFILTK